MSSRTAVARKTSRNTASASDVEKPFCGVCYNSGKTEKEYTSHYTKSVAGVKGLVCCPTILQHTCEYCKEKGHFKANCRALKKKEKMNQIENQKDFKEINNKNAEKILKKAPAASNKTAFALAFGDDSDDENDKKVKEKSVIRVVAEEKTPAEVIFIPKQYKISYSMVAKMQAKEKKDTNIQATKKTIEELSLFDFVKTPVKKIVMHSWADDDYWASDDDE